jgi:hypothetical protein
MQLRDRFGSAMNLAYVYDNHPEIERTPCRSGQHLSPNSCNSSPARCAEFRSHHLNPDSCNSSLSRPAEFSSETVNCTVLPYTSLGPQNYLRSTAFIPIKVRADPAAQWGITRHGFSLVHVTYVIRQHAVGAVQRATPPAESNTLRSSIKCCLYSKTPSSSLY